MVRLISIIVMMAMLIPLTSAGFEYDNPSLPKVDPYGVTEINYNANVSWNETHADDIYVNEDGDIMTGALNVSPSIASPLYYIDGSGDPHTIYDNGDILTFKNINANDDIYFTYNDGGTLKSIYIDASDSSIRSSHNSKIYFYGGYYTYIQATSGIITDLTAGAGIYIYDTVVQTPDDSDLYFLLSAVEGSPRIIFSGGDFVFDDGGNIQLDGDYVGLKLGEGGDAVLYYDGANTYFENQVGSGDLVVATDLNVSGNITAGRSIIFDTYYDVTEPVIAFANDPIPGLYPYAGMGWYGFQIKDTAGHSYWKSSPWGMYLGDDSGTSGFFFNFVSSTNQGWIYWIPANDYFRFMDDVEFQEAIIVDSDVYGLKLGEGQDVKIYYDGSNTYLDNLVGSGSFIFDTPGYTSNASIIIPGFDGGPYQYPGSIQLGAGYGEDNWIFGAVHEAGSNPTYIGFGDGHPGDSYGPDIKGSVQIYTQDGNVNINGTLTQGGEHYGRYWCTDWRDYSTLVTNGNVSRNLLETCNVNEDCAFQVPYDGSVTTFTVNLDTTRSCSNVMDWVVTINGVNTNLAFTLNNTMNNYTTQARGIDTFSAGDLIKIRAGAYTCGGGSPQHATFDVCGYYDN